MNYNFLNLLFGIVFVVLAYQDYVEERYVWASVCAVLAVFDFYNYYVGLGV